MHHYTFTAAGTKVQRPIEWESLTYVQSHSQCFRTGLRSGKRHWDVVMDVVYWKREQFKIIMIFISDHTTERGTAAALYIIIAIYDLQ